VSKILKNTKDVLKRMEEILGEEGQTQQPNILAKLKAAAGLKK